MSFLKGQCIQPESVFECVITSNDHIHNSVVTVKDYKCLPIVLAARAQIDAGLSTAGPGREETLAAFCCGVN